MGECILDMKRYEMLMDEITWNEAGLIPAIAQDAESGEVLMMAWMNRESLMKTLVTGKATYWSRSRKSLWLKGETSGHIQEIVEIRVDCDADTLLLKIRQTGAACHTGERSCFFRYINNEGEMTT
jgi:phosphoribosyl-AMP cyclohydrolase